MAAPDSDHEVILVVGDLRLCQCGRSVGISGGKFTHVPSDIAAADRAYASITYHARVGPAGIRVTVDGPGDAELVPRSIDGQTDRSQQEVGDGDPDGDTPTRW